MKENLKYHLITFGCQMNKADSDRIRSVLNSCGMKETDNESEAYFILINTCSVRQSAEDRVYGFMAKYDKMRKGTGKNLVLGVTGCMAGRDKDGAIRKRLNMVDIFLKIGDIQELPNMLNAINSDIESYSEKKYVFPLDYLNIEPSFKNSYQMFLPIQSGCNRFCTYCVVPFARGLEVNRPFEDIMLQARNFVENGGKEISLLGQTVNSYEFPKGDKVSLSKDNPYKNGFAALLYEIDKLDGLERIFYTAPHPDDMNDECIDSLGLDKMMNYLHLPVQSGSNKILKLMKRNYTCEDFIDVVGKIRKKVPNIAFGTDIIVGFCEETEKDFQDTYDLYKELDFDISYTAKYSIRSGTFAAEKLEDTVLYKDKQKRWRSMQDLMEKITSNKNMKFKDKQTTVLFESYKDGVLEGWSNEMKKVQVVSEKDLVGTVQNVVVKDPRTWLLYGELV